MTDWLEWQLFRLAYALGLVYYPSYKALGLGSGYTSFPWPWLRGKRMAVRTMCPGCEGSGYADYAAVACELCEGSGKVLVWR